MTNHLGINVKGKVGQFLCKHKNTQWFVKQSSGFQMISGEKRLNICMGCGKEVGSYFAEYEGMGFK